MTDREFEADLFAMYGTPTDDLANGQVEERTRRRVVRGELLRSALLSVAVGTGVVIALGILALAGGPAATPLVTTFNLSIVHAWVVSGIAATTISWGAMRLALNS